MIDNCCDNNVDVLLYHNLYITQESDSSSTATSCMYYTLIAGEISSECYLNKLKYLNISDNTLSNPTASNGIQKRKSKRL